MEKPHPLIFASFKALLSAVLSVFIFSGCDMQAKSLSASTETAKSVPGGKEAVVRNEILPGPISLNATPVPFAPKLSDSRNITVRLDVTHHLQEVSEGVKMWVWSFGGQVPGPSVRVRQGDKVHVVMANRSSETAQLTPAMPHSLDMHAAMVNPEDKFRSVAPGQTIEYDFVANYPGVYLYHCATPLMADHLAHGMYGAMIVEPAAGYPTKVDREYVIVQSEFFPKKPAAPATGRRTSAMATSEARIADFDYEAMKQKRPSVIAFNGKAFRHMSETLKAKAGDRVRMFVLNIGPSQLSTFHVIGGVFDRTWIEGVPSNELRGGQAVNLGPSNTAIVEFIVPESGRYELVDHDFADASLGATGILEAS